MTKENLSPIKSRIREYLSLRGVAYNEHTKTYRCPNPSHNDENPSATVYDNTNLLYCPVCNKNYDVFAIEEFITGEHDFVKLKKSVKDVLNITDVKSDAPVKSEKQKAEKPVKTEKPIPVPIPRDQIAEVYAKQKSFFERVGKSSKWGDLKTAWQYTDLNNDIIALDIRYENGDDATQKEKTVMTWWFNGKTWQTKNYPVIIYNLYEAINSTKPILIVEGAKCAYEGKKHLSEWFTVISWNGGSSKAHLVDWSLIANKEIFILPDDDEPGIKAAMTIKEKLPQSKVIRHIEQARTIKPKGADIIEILQIMSPQELTAFILDKNNHINNNVIVSSPLTSPPDESPDIESDETVLSHQSDQSTSGGNLNNNDSPFKILGLGDDGQAYFIGHDDRLYSKKLEGINRQFLRMLAPPNPYWISEYPSKQGIRWDDAESDIVLLSQAKDFDKDIIRGRGAWRDNGKIVYHDGTSPNGETSGKFMYLKLRQNDIGINDEPIDAETSREIARNIMKVSFETKTDAARCMAWAALAPFAGALRYRPTLLITGSSGSGKSTVLKKIICRIAHNAIKGDARETTPAGIRQKTGKDAAVWILDEAEKKTEKQKLNMEEIFSFMRSNFSDDSFDSYKGTKDGNYLTYKMNSMFCLAAIDPTIQEAADSNRIFKINIAKPTREQQQEWQQTTSKNIDRLLTHENCRRILARTWQNLEKIENLIDVVASAIGDATGKDLRSCESDAYLLSAFIVVYDHNDNPTIEQIKATVDKFYEYQPAEEIRNESEEWVDTYLDTIVEVLHENSREKITLRECLTREYRDEKYDENGSPIGLPASMKRSYRETTGRYGVRLSAIGRGNIAIASNHPAIKNIMKCANGYSAILQRHPGFEKQPKGNFRNESFPDKQRQCTIISGVLLIKPSDKTDDDRLSDVIMG